MSIDEDVVARLAQKVVSRLGSTDQTKRIIIGIFGVPGSGKTTLAASVCAQVNAICDYPQPVSVAISMDGFHYSRAQLAVMPDPVNALARRGAAFTFDGPGFLSLIESLAVPTDGQTIITAPSFDHAVKDPVTNSIRIPASCRIVFVEGNYCALNRKPWSDAAAIMTELWYVDTPKEIAWERLARRHLLSGIVKDEEEAINRAKGTDELNAQDIRHNSMDADEIIT